MKPIIIREHDTILYQGPEGVRARVLIDAESCGATNVAIGHISFNSGASVPPHTRDVEEFIYVIEGTATILSVGEKLVLNAGDSIYIPSGTEHQHLNEDDKTLKQLYIFSPQGPERAVREWPRVPDANL